jgi:hypothetical protein
MVRSYLIHTHVTIRGVGQKRNDRVLAVAGQHPVSLVPTR